VSALTAEQYALCGVPPGSPRSVWLMLRSYFDDSGTHSGAPAVVWGGLIGTDEQWGRFDRDWRALLAKPLPDKEAIRKFSVGDCRRCDGEFFGYGKGDSDRLRYLFRDVIKTSGVSAIAAIGSHEEWKAVDRSYKFLGPPEKWTLQVCICKTMTEAERLGIDKVSVCFDRGQMSCQNQIYVSEILDKIPIGRPVPTIVWGSVEEFTPLQGADTIATEVYWAMASGISNKHIDMRITLQSLMMDYQLKMFVQTRDTIRAGIIKNTGSPWYRDYSRTDLPTVFLLIEGRVLTIGTTLPPPA
jgi:hypothetical protein